MQPIAHAADDSSSTAAPKKDPRSPTEISRKPFSCVQTARYPHEGDRGSFVTGGGRAEQHGRAMQCWRQHLQEPHTARGGALSHGGGGSTRQRQCLGPRRSGSTKGRGIVLCVFSSPAARPPRGRRRQRPRGWSGRPATGPPGSAAFCERKKTRDLL